MSTDTYRLRPSGERLCGVCPKCRGERAMEVMVPEEGAPPAIAYELLLRCPSCGTLAIPPGVFKRAIGLLLIVPFVLLLCGGVATGGWMVWTLIAARELDGGSLAVALVLLAGSTAALKPALRTLLRLLRPSGLLPLEREAAAAYRFSGDL
jgi:hypothetical protein